MEIELPLIEIEKISSNHCLNMEIQLNDGYLLFIVGSFSIYKNSKLLLSSAQFVSSNFTDLLLNGIKILVENKRVIKATCSDTTGAVSLVLEDDVVIESDDSDKNIKSWQFIKSGKSIYHSEYGRLIHFK